MRIELGAAVWTHDGKMAGKVRQLDVDSSKQTLDSFVVHTGLLGEDLIVPVGDIERVDADDTIHLKITTEQLRALPQLFVARFARDSTEIPEDEISHNQLAPESALPMSAGGMLTPMTPVGQQFEPGNSPFYGTADTGENLMTTASSLPDNEFGITRGTRVVTADGHHVGKVHELRVTDEGALRGLIIATGLFRTHHYYIPFKEVQGADSEEVRLRMTAAQVEELERMMRPDAGQA